eukprot:COSAG05_NODE_1161_length_5664_cov_2.031626_3_plen_146_part_00
MADIYLHIVARMADYIAAHPVFGRNVRYGTSDLTDQEMKLLQDVEELPLVAAAKMTLGFLSLTCSLEARANRTAMKLGDGAISKRTGLRGIVGKDRAISHIAHTRHPSAAPYGPQQSRLVENAVEATARSINLKNSQEASSTQDL